MSSCEDTTKDTKKLKLTQKNNSSDRKRKNCMEDWPALICRMSCRIRYLFDNELMSDVQFIVHDEIDTKRISAHKFLLSVRSSVFKTMFSGALACEEDEIEITDIKPAAFYALLRYLYTDDIELTDVETVISTLYAAEKYMVPSLKDACVSFLSNKLSYENAILILLQARLHEEHCLEAKCWKKIDQHAVDIFGTEDFTNLDLDTLCLILTRNSLNITEADLFEVVLKWSIAECERQELPISGDNHRAVLGRVVL